MNHYSPEIIDGLLAKHSSLLSFPKEFETYFQKKLRAQRIHHIAYSSWVGIVVYLLFGISDYVLLPDIYPDVWRMRFLVGTPLGVLTILAFPYIKNHRVGETVVAFAATVIAAVTCWLILQSRSPLAAQEVAGFCLFMVYSNVVVRYRFVVAAAVSILFLIFFAAVSFQAAHIPPVSHVNNFVMLISTALLSLIGNYWHEIEERRSFLLAERDLIRKEELQHANDRLEGLSYRDGLTSAYNKRYFDMRFRKLLAHSQQTRTPLALLFIDVDHFKQFNDNYGHVAGDKTLISLTEIMQIHLRRKDEMLARIGGEEFVGLLPGVTSERACEVAEEIRESVEQLGIPHAHSSTAQVVTISIGVASATFNRPLTAQELLAAADTALYRAKQRGRNRISVHED